MPVVTVRSSTGLAVLDQRGPRRRGRPPGFSQVTWISAGASCATRRKCALVATGCGSGEQSSTARSTVAISTPPLTAGGALPPGATSANRWSGRAS